MVWKIGIYIKFAYYKWVLVPPWMLGFAYSTQKLGLWHVFISSERKVPMVMMSYYYI